MLRFSVEKSNTPRRVLKVVPEQIRRNRITPHRFGHLDAVAPVFPGDPRRVHFSADDLQRFAVEKKFLFSQRKRTRFLSKHWGRKPHGRKYQRKKGDGAGKRSRTTNHWTLILKVDAGSFSRLTTFPSENGFHP